MIEKPVEFQDFCASIASPAVRAVARHWNSARGAQMMPSRTQIRATELVKQVPIVWSYSFDRATGHFTGRLAGERISRIFSKNIFGISPEEVHPPEAADWVKAIFMRVVSEPAVYRSSGRVFRQLDRYGLGERMIFPLASDGTMADGILGVTEYDLYRQPGPVLPPVQVFTEEEQWFPLSDLGS